MTNTWLVLLPPLIILLSAFTTKNIALSLILGVSSASLIASDFNIISSIILILNQLKNQIWDLDNIYIFGFLFIIGILVNLLNYTGGAHALANIFTKKLKSIRATETTTVLFSFCFFIDDYLNCLTVGHIMRPITDKFKIPRAKLAFLLDSMTAPMAIIAPISSWAGVIISQLAISGISLNLLDNPSIIADPFIIYLKSIPFIFYSFITITSLLFIINKKISFGTMYKHEQIAKKTGNLFANKKHNIKDIKSIIHKNSHISDFLLPIVILILGVFFGILYQGNYILLGGTETSIITIFQQKYNIFPILFSSGLLSLCSGLSYGLIRDKIKLNSLNKIIINGINLMLPAILIVIISWTFGALLRDNLETGVYLAKILLGKINLVLLPALIYLVSTIIAIATGSSWGTLAIIVPIIIPMIISLLKLQTPVSPELVYLLIPSLGAMFSGSAAGDHISPVSDTTIMSANAAGADLIDHIKTQFLYTFPAIFSTTCAFVISGLVGYNNFWKNIIISLLSGLFICFVILLLLNKFFKPKTIK